MCVRSQSEWNWMPIALEVSEEKYSCAGVDLEGQMNCHGVSFQSFGEGRSSPNSQRMKSLC